MTLFDESHGIVLFVPADRRECLSTYRNDKTRCHGMNQAEVLSVYFDFMLYDGTIDTIFDMI